MLKWLKELYEKIFKVDKALTEQKLSEAEMHIADHAAETVKSVVESTPAPAPLNPYQMAKTQIGQTEVQGPGNNPQVIKYHTATSLHATSDDIPWCSAFVNWCFVQAGLKAESSNSAAARSWLKCGNAITEDQAKEGDVVVFWRGSKSGYEGHVAFLAKAPVVGESTILVLGGNQSNAVNVTKYSKANILGYRRFSYNNV